MKHTISAQVVAGHYFTFEFTSNGRDFDELTGVEIDNEPLQLTPGLKSVFEDIIERRYWIEAHTAIADDIYAAKHPEYESAE